MIASRRVAVGLAATLTLVCAPARAAQRAAPPPAVEVVQTTADLAQHLTRLSDLQFSGGPVGAGPVINVNDRARRQRIAGFGAAMTDSSAWLLMRNLPARRRGIVLRQLFGPGGLTLDFLRVPMGASDFSRAGKPYTYDDLAPGATDPTLAHFSIAHDRAYVLPALRRVLAINPRTAILANPWSAPAWMKANDALDNVKHHGTLLPSAYRPWASYFVRFIQAYEQAGVPITAITPQNEPMTATHYPGLELPETAEASWIVKDLRPALRAAALGPKIYGDDQGWGGRARPYAASLASGPAAGALAGIAWHCYFGSPLAMAAIHRAAPHLEQIMDECAPAITPFPTSEIVIASVRNWASTVALWNLALDPRGGPVQPPNSGCPRCMGLVTIDARTHKVTPGLDYFELGQASAFVLPGARRLSTRHFVRYDYTRPGLNLVTPGLDDVAFVNPDGSHVLMAYANSSQPISFSVAWQGQSFSYTLPAQATVTFRWR